MKFSGLFLGAVLAIGVSGCAHQNYLKAADGVPIAYDFRAVPEARGTVVLVHGLGTSLEEWYHFSRALNEAGWATLALDLRGHGMSTEWEGQPLDWRNFSAKVKASSVRDVDAALVFLKDAPNVWIAGSSFGANLAVLSAAEHPFVRGLVLFSPGVRMGEKNTDTEASRLGGMPVWISAAEDDPGAADQARRIFDKVPGPQKELQVVPKGGHGAQILENVPKLEEVLLEWMKQQSRP